MTFLRTYMPEIAWFDSRAPILAVDIQQVDVPKERVREFERDTERYYKLATVSTQSDVRIWDFCFGRDGQLFTDFIANLEGHNGTVNCCKFSPNGEMLATGDTFGALLVWYHSDEPLPPAPLDDYELPPNRENWKQQKKIKIRHDSDVTCVAWSPNSQFIASGSNDDSVSVFDVVNGKRLWMIRNFRHFPVGLAWDPRGKFLMSLSTDRRFDIIEATKGKQLRTAYAVEGLETKFGSNVESHATGQYKLYHDSQLAAFSRTMDFSPCGELLFTPSKFDF
uniref:WD_REPEATS_REGION domain-containing protein n=1 Tax=Panagrellus redivivus TaxID=6233 RepID=A0A7E4VX67_PANRE